MKIQKTLDNEFKIIVLEILREIQKNAGEQFNDIRKILQEQIEKFHEGVENINKFIYVKIHKALLPI